MAMAEANRKLVDKYMEAYNAFDIDGMLGLLDRDIVFKNFANGEVNTDIQGVEAFRELAEQSKGIFSSRCQTIAAYGENGDQAVVQIKYDATLAADLPNGWKSGDRIQLEGQSVFQFRDGKIVRLEDHS